MQREERKYDYRKLMKISDFPGIQPKGFLVRLPFYVLAPRDAHIVFAKTEAPNWTRDFVYEICMYRQWSRAAIEQRHTHCYFLRSNVVIGGWANNRTLIRRRRQDLDLATEFTFNVLRKDEPLKILIEISTGKFDTQRPNAPTNWRVMKFWMLQAATLRCSSNIRPNHWPSIVTNRRCQSSTLDSLHMIIRPTSTSITAKVSVVGSVRAHRLVLIPLISVKRWKCVRRSGSEGIVSPIRGIREWIQWLLPDFGSDRHSTRWIYHQFPAVHSSWERCARSADHTAGVGS